jgi:nitrate/nitrite transport system substrate-binding protein
MDRRRFLKLVAPAVAAPFVVPGLNAASAAGISNLLGTKPEQGSGELIKIGFIPLTDCASVVMAEKLGLYKKYGLNVEISKEASWANVRDKLLTGELSAAHCLFGMPFSVYTGVGGTAGKELKIAMMLNSNGQAITLAKPMVGKAAYANLEGAKAAVDELTAEKTPTFAMTFPGGTHDLWLRYWLGAAKVDPNTVKIVTIPPPQMVANMKVGNMDGFCVGEPWNGVAVKQDIGFTHIATQDIWQDHPEKALVANPDFAANRRNDLKLLVQAVLEASLWLDDLKNRPEAAGVIGDSAYVNAPADVIDARLAGKYDLGAGLGEKIYKDDYMLFYKDAAINFPRKSHAIWFLSQYVRFGYLPEAPDYTAIADNLIMQDLYEEAAAALKLTVPTDDMKPFTIKLDNVTFDPADPAKSLKAWA